MSRKSDLVTAAEQASSKSARTRERILDAAAHVLSRKGYAGTRLSDVAYQAEIQAPAIYYYYYYYYYFPSRDDLIEEVMWSGIAHMREHMTKAMAALPPDADPLERIDAAVEAHLPRRGSLEVVVRTAQSLVRHGLGTPQAAGEAGAAGVPGSPARTPSRGQALPWANRY